MHWSEKIGAMYMIAYSSGNPIRRPQSQRRSHSRLKSNYGTIPKTIFWIFETTISLSLEAYDAKMLVSGI